MRSKLIIMMSALGLAHGQESRQAVITGGGSAERGRCTVEVVVDGAAEVEIRGSTARLRNLSGQPPRFRRFECTSPMPANAADIRFKGVDGRGRQDLTRDPREGGVAVVRIEDRDNGREAYTFDIEWSGYSQGARNGYPQAAPPAAAPEQRDYRDRNYSEDRYRPQWRDSEYFRRNRHGFAVDEAVRVCQEAIARQAQSRWRRARDIHFLYTSIDDNPGRNDWVVGSIDVHRGGGQEERYNFSCSVDFNSGRVRTASLEQRPYGR